MQRRRRLRTRRDFAAIYSSGRSHRNNLLTVRVCPNNLVLARFGFVAGKAVGGAVERNRVKRRLREIARTSAVRPGYDILLSAHKAAGSATFAQLRDAARSLLDRAGVLQVADGARA